jgi:hypothetical protein
MKKLLGILLITLFIQPSAFSMSRDKLNKLKSKARNDYAASAIEDYCAGEDGWLEIQYGWACKCAIKAGKSHNKLTAAEILDGCGIW